jgi:hypothetical protein
MKVAQAGTNQIMNPNSATSKATRGTMAALRAGLDLASQSGTPTKRTVHATPYRTASAAPHQLGNGVHVQQPSRPAYAQAAAPGNQLGTAGPVTNDANGSAGVNGGSGRVLTAGSSSVPRLALPIAASSTTTMSPPTRKGGQPTYIAGTGTPGVVSSAQRRIVQPSRRNVQTPPVTGPRTIGIGSGTNPYTVTRSLAPITPRTPAAPITPSSPRRSPGPRVGNPFRAEKST